MGSDGEVKLDRTALSRALHADMRASVDSLSLGELSNDKFTALLSAALSKRRGLIIGGHNLGEEDYRQLVRHLVQHATAVFRRSVLGQPSAFRQAMLAEAHGNHNLLQEIQTYLFDHFGLMLERLEGIDETVGRVDIRTTNMDTKLNSILQRLPPSEAEHPSEVDLLKELRTARSIVESILNQLRQLGPPYVPAVFARLRQELDDVSDGLRKFKRSRHQLQIRLGIGSLVDPVGSNEAANLVNLKISARQLEDLLSRPYDESQVAYLIGRMQSKVEAVIDEIDRLSKMLE